MRSLVLPILFLVASPLVAQQADLSADLFVNDPLTASGPNAIFVDIENGGPDVAENVAVFVALAPGTTVGSAPLDCTALSAEVIRCPMGTLRASAKERLVINTSAPPAAGPATYQAEVRSDTPDPNRSNNFDSQTAQVTVTADLRIAQFFANPSVVRPGDITTWYLEARNDGHSDATDVVLSVQLPEGSSGQSFEVTEDWDCGGTGRQIICSREVFEAGTTVVLRFHGHTPGMISGGNVVATASITSATPDPDPSSNTATTIATLYRLLSVSNTFDSGDGSLRNALEDSAIECSLERPCRIEFDIAGLPKPGGWHTIQPQSQLPPVRTGVILDGSSQNAPGMDANPIGPEIELNGSLAGDSDGLLLSGGWATAISGLAINGFARNGILVLESDSFGIRAITDNFIGTDPLGRTAIPNGLRGIGIYSRLAGSLDIRRNVISGNRYSGLWIDGFGVLIDENRIGVAADDLTPVPNGASGIYFGPGSSPAWVMRNRIAHNAHWGIVLDRSAPDVSMRHNFTYANFAPGIDYGHDFATPNNPSDGIVDSPTLTSAVYDPASNTTRIRGTHTGPSTTPSEPFPDAPSSQVQYIFDFYSSSSSMFGDARNYLGELRTTAGGEFEFVHHGDLRGRFVSATRTDSASFGFKLSLEERPATREATSEFSAPIPMN